MNVLSTLEHYGFLSFILLMAGLMTFLFLTTPGGDAPFTCSDSEEHVWWASECVDYSDVEQTVVDELRDSGGVMVENRLISKTGLEYMDVDLTEDGSDRFYCWRGEDARYCELREDFTNISKGNEAGR